MDRVIGIPGRPWPPEGGLVGEDRPDAFCPGGGRRLAVGHDEAGVAELAAWGGQALCVMAASGGSA